MTKKSFSVFIPNMFIDNHTNLNFKAKPVSFVKVNNLAGEFKLYKITPEDKSFLDNLYNNIDFERLYPDLSKLQYIIWSSILRFGIENAPLSKYVTYLSAYNNKPCGLINFTPSDNGYRLNYVCTWPVEAKKRVPCAGQVLFHRFFNDMLGNNGSKAALSVLKRSPFNPSSKYMKLGFKLMGGDNWQDEMSITRSKAESTFGKLEKFIKSTPIQEEKNIDLFHEFA